MRGLILTLVVNVLIAFVGIPFCESMFAQESTSTKSTILTNEILKQTLEAACEENALPGMWAGRFSVGDLPPVFEAAGKRKWDADDSAQADDIVHLGSCTKAMTAVIIGQLCTEGKLRLDSTLKEVFREDARVAESEWGGVTINELLQHRSGATVNFWLYQSFDAKHPDSVIDARRELLQSLCKKKRPSTPGYVYSNVGFILLGHVAEHLEKKSWEEMIMERLFRPLGMSSAGFGPVGTPDGTPANTASFDGRAWGHTQSVNLFQSAKSFLGEKSKPSFAPVQLDNARCFGPAGRVHMNLIDWSKFVLAFATDDGNHRLKISSEIWREMLTPHQATSAGNQYASGWIVFDKPEFGGRAYFHNGTNTFWYCYAVAMPGKHCCILVATNVFTEPARKACDDVARFINKFPN